MSREKKPAKRRPGRGTLLAIGALFFASGVLRLADGTGNAIARQVEALAIQSDADATVEAPASSIHPADCATEDSLARALATLRERAAQLDEREKQIGDRMVSLDRAEAEIARNLSALVEAEDRLAATIAMADGAAEKDITRLTTVYEKMKPKDAAAVFEAMDATFAAGFLGRMRPDVAADILSGMSPAKAYTVSVLLAGRNAGAPAQ
ncbi:MotE family protein [Tropicimonas sp. IMCC6043]|uniref:MotE family protein n=1 Tax=Tropicimonas sp. IMCC6043 TaxID=2510645 RepID=UPI00101B756A|nr:hypothetical protein [Tropicimonas sp. IMCC6043]RYH09934.1 hypothetical protein EU800_10305 [Tropicimonas sp. IMCC6043]